MMLPRHQFLINKQTATIPPRVTIDALLHPRSNGPRHSFPQLSKIPNTFFACNPGAPAISSTAGDLSTSRQINSNNSSSMADSDNESGGHNAGGDLSAREQDRFLPIANVSRIMKKALPANAKISKDAKETVQECVSEFISFITGEASDKCQREKRKTINGDDLLWAMTTLGFEEYVEPLKVYLAKYRELEGEKTTLGRPGEKDGGGGVDSAAGGGGGGSGGGVNSGGYNGMYGGTGYQQMYNSGQYQQTGMGMGMGMGVGVGSPTGSLGRSGSIGRGSGASSLKPGR